MRRATWTTCDERIVDVKRIGINEAAAYNFIVVIMHNIR